MVRISQVFGRVPQRSNTPASTNPSSAPIHRHVCPSVSVCGFKRSQIRGKKLPDDETASLSRVEKCFHLPWCFTFVERADERERPEPSNAWKLIIWFVTMKGKKTRERGLKKSEYKYCTFKCHRVSQCLVAVPPVEVHAYIWTAAWGLSYLIIAATNAAMAKGSSRQSSGNYTFVSETDDEEEKNGWFLDFTFSNRRAEI